MAVMSGRITGAWRTARGGRCDAEALACMEGGKCAQHGLQLAGLGSASGQFAHLLGLAGWVLNRRVSVAVRSFLSMVRLFHLRLRQAHSSVCMLELVPGIYTHSHERMSTNTML